MANWPVPSKVRCLVALEKLDHIVIPTHFWLFEVSPENYRFGERVGCNAVRIVTQICHIEMGEVDSTIDRFGPGDSERTNSELGCCRYPMTTLTSFVFARSVMQPILIGQLCVSGGQSLERYVIFKYRNVLSRPVIGVD